MPKARLCSIDGCGKKVFGYGWCNGHYKRWRKHGDPVGGRPPNGAADQFIQDVVLNHTSDNCLTWPFSLDSKGYGQIWRGGRMQTVSRVVCEIINGPPPRPNYQAAHSCGKGKVACVNPKHLRWATCADNHADKIGHGTANRGERNGSATLTAKDVLAIRKLKGKMTLSEVGKQFGISFQQVSGIQRRVTWRWLP